MFYSKKQKSQKSQKGLSLIEASMVLALSAVVVSGVLYYFNMASNNRKLQENVKSIQSIISTVRSLYTNQPPGTEVDFEAIVKAGNYTKTKDNGGGDAILLPTGDTVNIYSGHNYANKRSYSLELRTRSSDVCAYISSMKFGTSHYGTEILENDHQSITDFSKLKEITPSLATTDCYNKSYQGVRTVKTKIYLKY